MNYDLFLSFSTRDRLIAKNLVKALNEAGITVWFSSVNMKRGESIPDEIPKAIHNSRNAIVLLSKNYYSSDWTARELAILFAKQKFDKAKIWCIWHDVNEEDVYRYQPNLLSIFAYDTRMGFTNIASSLKQEAFLLSPHFEKGQDGLWNSDEIAEAFVDKLYAILHESYKVSQELLRRMFSESPQIRIMRDLRGQCSYLLRKVLMIYKRKYKKSLITTIEENIKTFLLSDKQLKEQVLRMLGNESQTIDNL